MTSRFRDRAEAGKRLATRLVARSIGAPVVLGLPRGGVPVAFEVAAALHAPLDVILVRKLGVPGQPELALGAVGEDGVRVLDEDVLRLTQVSGTDLDAVESRERREVVRRSRDYRVSRAAVPLGGRTALIVDDGMATGSTMQAACLVARAHGAARVVAAVPVASLEAVERVRSGADEVVALETPRVFGAVGLFYDDFTQTTDDEVVTLLRAGLQHTNDAESPDDADPDGVRPNPGAGGR